LCGAVTSDERHTLSTIHAILGALVLLVNGGAGLWGAWLWWRAEPAPAFWTVLRTGQVLLVVQVLLGGVVLALGKEPPALHILYGALPLAIVFMAEQLRLVSAEQVLDRRGLQEAREMEALPDFDQRVIVREIVRRETGVVAAGALVATLLAARAAGVTGFLPV
jgi:hypothetical protein